MKKTTAICIVLTVINTSTHAEVFKCRLASDKTVYQSTPCPAATVKQDVVEIKKPDAEKIAEDQARFAAWKADLAAREAAELKAEKERQAELARQETVNALKRSAIAQEELAEAAKRPVIISPIVQPNWPFLNRYPKPNSYQNPYPNPYQNPNPAGHHHGNPGNEH